MNKKISVILLVIIIIGSGGIYLVTQKLLPSKDSQTEATTLDCKQNLQCLIQASVNCKPAKVINTATIDIFGVKQTTTSSLETKKSEASKCIFYLRTEKIDLAFPANTSQEIVNQQKETYKKLEGQDGTCKFNTNDLTAMLTRWSKGNFESGSVSCNLSPSGNVCKTEGGDFGVAECQGTYFEQPPL